MAKLTEADAMEIKRRALAGEKHRRIADDFGISKANVSAIKLGTNWSHIGEVGQ